MPRMTLNQHEPNACKVSRTFTEELVEAWDMQCVTLTLAGIEEAYLILDAALISFMAARTRWSGSMSVTRVWMIMNPKVLMLLVS